MGKYRYSNGNKGEISIYKINLVTTSMTVAKQHSDKKSDEVYVNTQSHRPK